jgi:hypothetical protein
MKKKCAELEKENTIENKEYLKERNFTVNETGKPLWNG